MPKLKRKGHNAVMNIRTQTNNFEDTIDLFLAEYKEGMIVYYQKMFDRQREIWKIKDREEYKDAQYEFYYANTKSDIEIVKEYSMMGILKLIDKDLVNRKAAFIKRVKAKTGDVILESNLRMGTDGSINGFVKGEDASVDVYSIIAGGYNIQKLHYRVLVREIR